MKKTSMLRVAAFALLGITGVFLLSFRFVEQVVPAAPVPGDQEAGIGTSEDMGSPVRVRRVVRATAYNAAEEQTDQTPEICAWGDHVRPGIIAVSRDLEKLGLTRGTEVQIEGVGKRTVMDRMDARKRNQIDLFMEELDDATLFGVRELVINWEVKAKPRRDQGN